MKTFIARFGHCLAYAIGIPKYTFNEAFEAYYRFGLTALIVMGSFMIICLIILLFLSLRRND